jgi:tetratricopeptide (TPR) repeat protein
MSDSDTTDIVRLKQAVATEPRNAELRYLLGAEMADAGDYDGAVLEMSTALTLAPAMHVARLQLGLLHLTMARPDHAQAVLAPLENLSEDSALLHFKRGLEALIVDEFDACLANLQHGIKLNRENEPLNRDMNLIIERVQSLLSSQATSQEASEVRTDFSLYSRTRH